MTISRPELSVDAKHVGGDRLRETKPPPNFAEPLHLNITIEEEEEEEELSLEHPHPHLGLETPMSP